jgi:hypothetical protein
MKIVCIFASGLFAMQYKGKSLNELARLIELWNDPKYIEQWLWVNQNDFASSDLDELASRLIEDAFTLEEMLLEALEVGLDKVFRPLHNLASAQLFISKEKLRKNYFRLYAIRIDVNCYVITGGAIKAPMVLKMQERAYLKQELDKLEFVHGFLKGHQIVDKESFYEMLEE